MSMSICDGLSCHSSSPLRAWHILGGFSESFKLLLYIEMVSYSLGRKAHFEVVGRAELSEPNKAGGYKCYNPGTWSKTHQVIQGEAANCWPICDLWSGGSLSLDDSSFIMLLELGFQLAGAYIVQPWKSLFLLFSNNLPRYTYLHWYTPIAGDRHRL